MKEVKKLLGASAAVSETTKPFMSQQQYDRLLDLGRKVLLRHPMAQLYARHREKSNRFTWSTEEFIDVRIAYQNYSPESRVFVIGLMERTLPRPDLGKDVSFLRIVVYFPKNSSQCYVRSTCAHC